MKFENNELDKLINTFGQWIIEDETCKQILNPIRMAQIRFSDNVLDRMARETDMRVTTIVHEPYNSMGSISVEGEALEFSNCKWLGRVIEFASNVEIFPLLNGKIKIVLTFHGLTTPIETK